MSEQEKIEFIWNEKNGEGQLIFETDEKITKISHMDCVTRLKDGEILKATQFTKHEMIKNVIKDEIGEGICYRLKHYDDERISMIQTISCYQGFLLCGLTVESETPVSTNYMAPLYCNAENSIEMEGEIRVLAAPFDNDKWAKFVDYPFGYATTSYEFSVIHQAGGEEGLVVGSVDHDNWKTAIDVKEDAFCAYSGVATEDTRDLNGIKHGYLTGTKIDAARIFIGNYSTYQKGLCAFGDCNTKIKPALSWDGPVIFGWNSWAALMGDLTLDRYKEASDFMKTLQGKYCDTQGRQFINFDAFWDSFSNKMEEAVQYVEANGQMPGTYFCPFIAGGDMHHLVSGTDGNYFYDDLLLKDEAGQVLPAVDGLYSLDPTHPGTLAHMEYELQKIIKWGFRSIKTDFIGHGCREGAFYNKEITTGVQAFHYGMQRFVDILQQAKEPIFISLSIAPIFPYGYGHARRISCDAFGSLDQSEYLNNCISYLWWMNDRLYRFNDPDHIVTYKTYDKHSITLEEGRTRFQAGVICGSLMITSDDYRIPEARERATEILSNQEMNKLAQKGESFIPLYVTEEGILQGKNSADIFYRQDEDALVLAVFNYQISEERKVNISVNRLGFRETDKLYYRDLWSDVCQDVTEGQISLTLKPAQSTMLKIYHK